MLSSLTKNKVSRRDFMKACAAMAVYLGLSESFAPKIADAVENASKKAPVVWIEAQSCSGDTEAFLNSSEPTPAQILLDTISLKYQDTVMFGTGYVADKALDDAIKAGGYVLVVEGSIPTADPLFCTVGTESATNPARKPVIDTLKEAYKNAAVVIALGSCATWGGVVQDCPSKGRGVAEVLGKDKVINLPLCPCNPDHLAGTIVYYLTFKKAPPLDIHQRPLMFFGSIIHDNCPRRAHFERGEFVTDYGDPKQADYCLYLKGCKGPFTFSDCPSRGFNENVSWCIKASAPCAGCSQPEFYAGFSPLYVKSNDVNLPGIGGVPSETVGTVAAAVTALGVAAHLVGRSVFGKKKEGDK
ncbi:hydrogenase small subunit [Thermodesulfobium sp. 4217-1]|uniref:hydrogenase small subunit n=1 Tax=Thermodesulfobium sp. 4217-1 TaxID=3120013 RepID=UPI0032221687